MNYLPTLMIIERIFLENLRVICFCWVLEEPFSLLQTLTYALYLSVKMLRAE